MDASFSLHSLFLSHAPAIIVIMTARSTDRVVKFLFLLFVHLLTGYVASWHQISLTLTFYVKRGTVGGRCRGGVRFTVKVLKDCDSLNPVVYDLQMVSQPLPLLIWFLPTHLKIPFIIPLWFKVFI